jgi:putative addiction module CopG family antidote
MLPSEIKNFVDREVASGRYEDAKHVVIEALKRMADEKPTTVAEAIAESLTPVERGEVVE